jgi:hypothetical protein
LKNRIGIRQMHLAPHKKSNRAFVVSVVRVRVNHFVERGIAGKSAAKQHDQPQGHGEPARFWAGRPTQVFAR